MNAAVLVLSLMVGSASVEGPPSTSTPFELDPVVDITSTVGLFLFVAVLDGLVKPTLPALRHCDIDSDTGLCDPASLNALDRKVVGNYSRAWQRVSDITAFTAYGLPLVMGALDYFTGEEQGTLGDWATDLVIMGQAVGMTVLITDVFKYAVRRPRPTQFTEGVFSGSSEHLLGFPSGHTSSTAAAAFAYASTFSLRHPDSPWRYGMWGLASALSGLTAAGRVKGGMHFYTDVLASAFLGASIGIVVPYMQRKREGTSISLVPAVSGEGASLSLTGNF